MSKNTDKLFVYDELFQTIICFNKVTRWLIFLPMALCISRMKSSLQKKMKIENRKTLIGICYILIRCKSEDLFCTRLEVMTHVAAILIKNLWYVPTFLIDSWLHWVKKLKNCALWIFFYEFIIRNYPSLYFSLWTTQVWIVFL